jgi:acetyl esterase
MIGCAASSPTGWLRWSLQSTIDEHPSIYPAALDDMESAWHWAQVHAAELGGDGKRFAVAGDSSGGNLAAALTLRLRAQGALQPKLQLLLYPALDASCSRHAYREFASGFNLTAAQMQWYWNTYRGAASVDAPELSPLASPGLRALPPAVVAVAGYDVLRDDGVEYATRLENAGVPVCLIRCEGMIHGFLRWTGCVPAARRCIAEIADRTKEMLAGRL